MLEFAVFECSEKKGESAVCLVFAFLEVNNNLEISFTVL